MKETIWYEVDKEFPIEKIPPEDKLLFNNNEQHYRFVKKKYLELKK